VPRGLVPPWILLAAAALLFAAVAGWLHYRRDEYLVGQVTVLGVGSARFRREQKRTVSVVGEVPETEGIAVPGATWKLWVRAFAPKGAEGRPRGVYARLENGTARIHTGRQTRTRTLAREWQRLARGCRIDVEDSGTSITWN
jgi:hypothetical protein